jgi:hypothetical protein
MSNALLYAGIAVFSILALWMAGLAGLSISRIGKPWLEVVLLIVSSIGFLSIPVAISRLVDRPPKPSAQEQTDLLFRAYCQGMNDGIIYGDLVANGMPTNSVAGGYDGLVMSGFMAFQEGSKR